MSEIADRFRAMAALVEKNEGTPFGGACVLVLPGSEEVLEVLVLGAESDPDPAQFLALVKTRIDMMTVSMERSLQRR